MTDATLEAVRAFKAAHDAARDEAIALICDECARLYGADSGAAEVDALEAVEQSDEFLAAIARRLDDPAGAWAAPLDVWADGYFGTIGEGDE